jgi:hypothetical protein
MGMLVEKKVTLLKEEEALIEKIFSNDFPYYYATTDEHYDCIQFFHSLMNRQFDPESNGIINSTRFDSFVKMFLRLCREENIGVSKIYRACINNTFYHPDKHGNIHTDHHYEHCNFLLYLNDFDRGDTYLFDEDNNIKHTIKSEKYKMAIFDGDLHAQGFCAPGQMRTVMVFTFKRK